MMITAGIIILMGLYFLLMAALVYGWFRLKKGLVEGENFNTLVSIVIPARNEEKALPLLLQDIKNQQYPPELIEVIVIDDQSDDQTVQVVKSFKDLHLKLIVLSETGKAGKKSAVETGVQQAGGELIIATDADCRAGTGWVRSIVHFYSRNHPALILSPVKFENGNNIFGWLQELEFLSLQFSTAGSASLGVPLLANGANLAYSRESFLASGGYEKNRSVPSGDDVFLLHDFKHRYGGSRVQYLRNTDACVKTGMEKTWSGFLAQRLRWVSKTRGIHDPFSLTVSTLVFLVNMVLLFLLPVAIFSPTFSYYFLLFYLFKTLIDLLPFIIITHFFKRKSILWLLPFLEIVNALYTTTIGILGNVVSYTWKGRTPGRS